MKEVAGVAYDLAEIWVYLSATPLFGLTLTLLAYQCATWVYERSGRSPLANPVALSVALIVPVLAVGGVPYKQYFEGAQFVHFLLGTATVALAVPLFRVWHRLGAMLWPLILALLLGGATSIAVGCGMAWALGAPQPMVLALAAKSVTAPIAMGIAREIGAPATLAAIFAVLSGIVGAVCAKFVLDALHLTHWPARGFAIGVASHGIGSARAYSVHPEAGAFASLAMGLHGIAGAVLIPAGWQLWQAIP
jgi:putative effector of murein hydrolase